MDFIEFIKIAREEEDEVDYLDFYNNVNICSKVFNYSRCLKITEKVSFYIPSEASYAYILNGQK